MKKWIIAVVVLLVLGGLYLASPFLFQSSVAEPDKQTLLDMMAEQGEESFFLPSFTEIESPYAHKYGKGNSVPFVGAALIDVDGNGIQEIFVGGGEGQDDVLLTYEDSAFTVQPLPVADPDASARSRASYGVISLDFDDDGAIDLLVAKSNDIYWYQNVGDEFLERPLSVPLPESAEPLSLAAADINKDGAVDLYINTFIEPSQFKPATFNDPNHGRANVMLLNNGDNTFTDVTESAGLLLKQNTFLSVFTDLNNDGWQDLIASTNTDQVRIYQNLQDGTFLEQIPPTENGFWMGLAVSDIDRDGDLDLFLSNTGTTLPLSVARGDLRPDQAINPDWVLLQNEGNFQFTNVTEQKGVSGYEFGWGPLFTDLNLDGRQDLLVAQNYIKWPAHKLKKNPGRVFLQMADGHFQPVAKALGLENSYFGNGILSSDFNLDGAPDVVFVNIDGPLRVLIQQTNENGYLKVRLPDRISSIGARIVVTLNSGEELVEEVLTASGYLTDGAPEFLFGLGKDEQARRVQVVYSSGKTVTRTNVPVNTTVNLD